MKRTSVKGKQQSHAVRDPEAYACISHQMQGLHTPLHQVLPTCSLGTAQQGAGWRMPKSFTLAASPRTVCTFAPRLCSLTHQDPASSSQAQQGCAGGRCPSAALLDTLRVFRKVQEGAVPWQPCTPSQGVGLVDCSPHRPPTTST